MRWVTYAWRSEPSMLGVCARGLSCRTAEARGIPTGAVLGQVVDVHALAVHRRLWASLRSCSDFGSLLEVPPTQSSPELWAFSVHRDMGFQLGLAMRG